MIHLRKAVFEMLAEHRSDEEIAEAVRGISGITLTPPRVANYRELYNRLDETSRAEFVNGKRDLLGNRT